MEPPAESGSRSKRKRASRPKVRSGCITCKARRVKCDELKPSCQRCKRAHRECGGYVPVGATVFDFTLSDSSSETASLLSCPLTGLATLEESRAMRHFQENTAFALGSRNSVVQDFFHTLVLQISHSEPCIKHMVVATSSLHEGVYRPPSESVRAKTFFSHHYSQAVALLARPNSPPSLEIILTACLLFISCENFQGSTMAGLLHIQSGLSLIKDWKSRRSLAPASIGSADWLIHSRIEPIFKRLRDQTSKYRPSRTFQHSASSTDPDIMTCSPVVQCSFHDLFVARDKLLDIMQWALQYAKSPQMKSYKPRIQQELENWDNAVTKYTQKHLLQDSLEGRTLTALRVHHRLISIVVGTSFASSEIVFDQFQAVFQRILKDCDYIIKHHDSGRMTLFEYDFGIIPPLFSLACRCRDPGLRRRAIRLLRSLHRSEGLWDSCYAAQIAEDLLRVEGEGPTVLQNCQGVVEQNCIQAIIAQPASIQRSNAEPTFTHPQYEAVDDATRQSASCSTRRAHSHMKSPLTNIIHSWGYQGLVEAVPGACSCSGFVPEKGADHLVYGPTENGMNGSTFTLSAGDGHDQGT